MVALASTLPGVVLGLGAAILAISLFVQVVQEIWKFLTSSRARCYTRVLEDFLGPWAVRMLRPGVLPELQARGPFQLRRLAPAGLLLPLAREDLVEGLERTAAPWLRRGLRVLKVEAALQAGKPAAPSAEWLRFARELSRTDSGGPGAGDAAELTRFLAEAELGTAEHLPKELDAARAHGTFRERFFAHVADAERHFGRLEQLFEYQWRRRNLRQTFVFGLLFAFFAAQPVQDIYRHASALSPEEAAAMAERVMGLYQAQAQDTTVGPTPEQLREALAQSLEAIEAAKVGPAGEINGIAVFRSRPGPWGKASYLFGCVITAVLVSFGAPFWNDLLGAILRLRRPAGPPAEAQRGGANG